MMSRRRKVVTTGTLLASAKAWMSLRAPSVQPEPPTINSGRCAAESMAKTCATASGEGSPAEAGTLGLPGATSHSSSNTSSGTTSTTGPIRPVMAVW